MAAAELATDAIETGLAEPTLVSELAAGSAPLLHDRARRAARARGARSRIGRARLELAVLHPDAALAAIDEAL